MVPTEEKEKLTIEEALKLAMEAGRSTEGSVYMGGWVSVRDFKVKQLAGRVESAKELREKLTKMVVYAEQLEWKLGKALMSDSMTLWKSQCKDGHSATSSEKVDKCPFCGGAFTVHVEVSMSPEGIITKDLIKGRTYLQKFDGSPPEEVK